MTKSTSKRETLLAVALIVLATLLTYGVLISRLGFYRDDWYLLWTAESQGTAGLLNLFRGDRPFLGWLYILDFSMLGVAPLGWHLYALFIKVASALAFFWLMRNVGIMSALVLSKILVPSMILPTSLAVVGAATLVYWPYLKNIIRIRKDYIHDQASK